MQTSNYSSKWWAAFAIGIGMFCIGLDFTIVNTALASIQRNLRSTIQQLQWIMNVVVLVVCVLVVTMGRIADNLGRKKMHLIGLGIFFVASVGAGLSKNSNWLIVFRAFQGLSIAISIPASQALMINSFSPNEKGKALGIWAGVVAVGLAIGPVIGGIIVSNLRWSWIFFICLPFILISFFSIIFLVKESKNSFRETKIDWMGLGLVIVGIGALVIGIIQGGEWGWASPSTLFLFVIAVLALVILYGVERQSQTPIIPFKLFVNHNFFSAASTNFALLFFVWAIFFFIPLYLHNIQNLDSSYVGFLLLLITLPAVILSPIVNHYSMRINPKTLVIIGVVFILFATFTAASFNVQTGLDWIIITFLFMGIGWGVAWGPSTKAGISSLSADVVVIASGGLTTIQEIGGALGLAVAGAIFRHYDTQKLQQQLTAAHFKLTREQAEGIRAALSDPANLQLEIQNLGNGNELLINFFKQSFMAGFSVVMWLLFFTFLAALIIVLFTLKKSTKVQN